MHIHVPTSAHLLMLSIPLFFQCCPHLHSSHSSAPFWWMYHWWISWSFGCFFMLFELLIIQMSISWTHTHRIAPYTHTRFEVSFSWCIQSRNEYVVDSAECDKTVTIQVMHWYIACKYAYSLVRLKCNICANVIRVKPWFYLQNSTSFTGAFDFNVLLSLISSFLSVLSVCLSFFPCLVVLDYCVRLHFVARLARWRNHKERLLLV